MNILKDLKSRIITGLLPIALLLNYIVDNIIIRKIIVAVYISLILLHSIYIASKNKSLNRKDKSMLIVIIVISILIFIYLYNKK